MNRFWIGLNVLGLVLVASSGVAAEKMTDKATDHSYANTDVVAQHYILDLKVDFDAKKIRGSSTVQFKSNQGAKQIVLDTNDLTIAAVTNEAGKPLTYKLGKKVKYLGQSLTIDIAPSDTMVVVSYETSPSATALQWLPPSQTAGKKMPYLLTQSQAILARSWIPCQDAPRVRATYEATVQVPAGMMAIMSGENPQVRSTDGRYHFKMPQAVPSYLFALAVGDIDFAKIDHRIGVYAEPSVLKSAVWEFADLDKMMAAAEKMYGPYRWGRYDVLVLPPSFPFGGMENPRLTFVSPTLIAGDRSLVYVVAHELAHSWSGNLVTNANWEDFWLNEGFTTYFEGRLTEAVYGKTQAEMGSQLELDGLKKTLADKELSDADKHLKLALTNRDPDDGMTDVAYVKGMMFLRTIESLVGRSELDKFLRTYFDTFAFQSMTTEKFLAYLDENLLSKAKNAAEVKAKLQIDAWIHGPTLPAHAAVIETPAFAQVDAEVKRWVAGTEARKLKTKGWSTSQWLRFLNQLPTPMTPEQLQQLDRSFHFTQSGNAEILTAWFTHTIRNRYVAANEALQNFLVRVGRRKFVKPLFAEMVKDSVSGLPLAQKIYAMARPGYHAVTVATVDNMLKWKKK